ncbi:MAG: YraN family protein [Candidatus Pacebacteria bacterium]|nr:YraN family protein [Candidatus Paceibacterota bacterium]
MAQHLNLGKEGEDITVKHLVKHGYKILERNYRKKWGEIDVIAESFDKTRNKKILHFIEVKSVSYETDFENLIPEANVHFHKKQRLEKTIKTYLAEKNISENTEFQIDVFAILVDSETRENKIRITENIIFE